MLDGLLGRGFAFKCKSPIKAMATRVDAIKRKRNAAQMFLKKDIADLLAQGLDVQAYNRTEGFLADLGYSSCYDFILQSCAFILSHLSVMEKQRECPEECREAVSTLMFAAARFSDLPELRDLRHIFQDRYGNSVEHFVNQEFVAKSAKKLPTLEKKVRFLQEIASEFTINWDPRGFDPEISKSSATPAAVNQLHMDGSLLPDKFKPLNGEKSFPRSSKHDAYFDVSKSDPDPLVHGGHVSKHKPPSGKKSSVPKAENGNIPVQPRLEFGDDQHESWNGKAQSSSNTEMSGSSSHGRRLEYIGYEYNVCDGGNKLVQETVGHHTSSYRKTGLPPTEVSIKSEECHNEDDMSPLAKQSVSRRRRSKSVSRQDDNSAVNGTTFGKGGSSSRRDKPQGLQILIDDAKRHHQKDEEDRLLDNMLVHLSKKHSSFEPEKMRQKLRADPKHHRIRDGREIPWHNRSPSGPDANVEMLPPRSVSLPHEAAAHLDSPKVIARATSLQENTSNPARHVHPKLPNYDDLAARFASLKGK